LVDQDGSGQIRWQANQNADKYYIYFDTLNHEGHPLPKFATLGEPFINATAGTPEAGGYFHQITNAEPYGLSVWTAPIEEKILPNAKAPVSSQPLKIYAARGEFESFQIIVNSPFTTSLKVNISDLTNKSASINANQIELFRLDYIEISTISDQFGRLGSWPDPLYPIRFGDKITFSAKKNQPLWFRIKVPYEAMPGVYSGCVSIGSATIPISLELWDFSMPQDIFFDTEFGFDWDTVMEVYGGTKSGVKDKCYDTVKEAMEAAFLDYHISPLPSGTIPPEDDLVYSLTNYEVFLAHQQQIAYSTRVWWEFVFSDYPPFPNPAVIDRPGLDARVLPWMAWLNRVDGIYYPESADWDPDPWSLIFSNSKSNGDSFLFYPPKDDTLAYDPCEVISSRLVPSMRLELLREGLEDYAYLLLLNGRLPELAKENPSDILAKSFIGSRSAFNRVPTTIESLRLQIAEYILTQETKKIYLPFISH